MRASDLRLIPAATVVWVLAVLGVAAGAAAAVAGAAIVVTIVLSAIMATGGTRAGHGLFAHLGIVVLAGALLFPALHRTDATTRALDQAAAADLRVELAVTASAEPAPPSSGPAWSRNGVQVMVRTAPGTAIIGRSTLRLPGKVPLLLRASDEVAEILATARGGDTVRVRGTLRASGGLQVLNASEVTIAPRTGVSAGLREARQHLREQARTATSHLPDDEAALVRGMTSGDTAGLGEHSEEIMRRAGISHLIAVSGANIALVIGAVTMPLLLAGVRRRPRILLAAATMLGYLWLVGNEPSVLRAATMAAPLLAARFAGVRGSPVAALAMTVGLWSVIDPVTAASVGFMLSALATAAILIAAPPLAAAITELSSERVPGVLALVLAVPFVAQLACTPILILLTPEISIWAVPVNLLVGPIVGPTTVLGLIALLIGIPWPGGAALVNAAAGGGAHLVLLIARTADQLPGSRIAVPEGTLGVLAAIGVCLAVVIAVAARRSPIVHWVLAALLVVAIAPTAGRFAPVRTGPDWIIAACAVGQGDAVLLRSAPGAPRRTVLIDTGPDPAALQACLDRLAVDRIDLLVLSHPHADHTGGTAALNGDRTPRAQWICPLPEAAGRTVAAVPAVAVTTGQQWQSDGLSVDVLWPPSTEAALSASARERGSGEGDAANDCSVTLSVQWPEGLRLVTLGDLEPAAQRDLSALKPGPADIVKVAHHGSRFQDEGLYQQLDADLALITVGQENTFGHPTDDLLAILRDTGTSVVRTDQHGTVILPAQDPRAPRSVGPAR